MQRTAAVVLALTLAACGRQAPEVESDDWLDGIPGTYAMDARRTLGDTVPGPDGKPIPLTDEKVRELESAHGASAMRLVIKEGGTFEIVSGSGETGFRTAGTWQETPGGLALETKTVNGEPVPDEMKGVVEQYTVERGYVIGEQAGKRVYMRKLKPGSGSDG